LLFLAFHTRYCREIRMETFGNRLRHAMAVRGIKKQLALAVQVGVDHSAVSRWQNGSGLSLGHAIRVCEALDISLDWLIRGRGTMDSHELRPNSARLMEFEEAAGGLPESVFAVLLAMARTVQAELGPDRPS
jgi:transcriptional regulator with XRE-family HTH domain